MTISSGLTSIAEAGIATKAFHGLTFINILAGTFIRNVPNNHSENDRMGLTKKWCRAAVIVTLGAAFASASYPSALRAETATFDLMHFSCWKIRRQEDRLELDRLTSDGPVTTAYFCEGRSCVNREMIETEDGTTSEVFRHIYFPRYRSEYISTWAMWRLGSEEPSVQRSSVYQLVQCE